MLASPVTAPKHIRHGLHPGGSVHGASCCSLTPKNGLCQFGFKQQKTVNIILLEYQLGLHCHLMLSYEIVSPLRHIVMERSKTIILKEKIILKFTLFISKCLVFLLEKSLKCKCAYYWCDR